MAIGSAGVAPKGALASDLASVLALVQDAKAFEAKIKQLSEAEARALKEKGELARARTFAAWEQELNSRQEKMLAASIEVEAKSKRVLDQARAEASRVVDESKFESSDRKSKLDATAEHLGRWERGLSEREAKLVKREEACAILEAENKAALALREKCNALIYDCTSMIRKHQALLG